MIVRAFDLTKRYGNTVALDRLNLTIPPGTVFGLLGPNGSGKTTFIKLLMGLINPDSGRIDRGRIRPHQLGYLPERLVLPTRSRIDEYVRLIAALCGLDGTALETATANSLRQAGLADVAHSRVGTCSKGMLQRLGLALALLGDPPQLVLDEPLEGLDPGWQKAVRDIILEQHRAGKGILLCTHRLSDVATLCTHVGILCQGRLKRAGPLAKVLPLQPQVLIEVDRLSPESRNSLGALHHDIAFEGNRVRLTGGALAHKGTVIRQLLDAGSDVQSLSHERATLEEVYLEAMDS